MNCEKMDSVASLPVSLSAELAGYEWEQNHVGESGGTVFKLHGKPGASDLYLKWGRDAIADDLLDETIKLRWLSKYLPAASVTHFYTAANEAWLVMTALAGETAYRALEARPEDSTAIVDAIAEFLRRLHSIPVTECPFNSEHGFRLSLARQRIDAGLVDEDDFDEEREGWTAERVWQSMQQLLPLSPDAVVTHGDFSLDNLLMVDNEVVGCIDAGRVGIADRYQDLAITWNCLGEFGAELQSHFLAQYGVNDLDKEKLQFHLMLDELF